MSDSISMSTTTTGSPRPSGPQPREGYSRILAAVVIVVWFACFPFVLHYAGIAWRAGSNRVEDWIPSGHPETRELDRFISLFQSEEVLVISWPGCTLDDPRLARLRRWARPQDSLEEEASGSRRDTGGEVGARLRQSFRLVITAQDLLETYEQWPGRTLTTRQQHARLRGWFLGADGRTTLAIGLLSEAGINDRQATVDAMREAAMAATGLELNELHLAGSAIDSVATDEANRESLLPLTLMSFLTCGMILLIVYRNLRISLLLLGIAIFNQQLSLAVVGWTGGRVDAVLLLMASVIFVLSVSAGCHFLRYVREALIQSGPIAAPRQALASSIRPTALAALTSAIGFASLMSSLVIPVQNFGMYAAAMVLVSGVLVPLLIIVSFTLLPTRTWHRRLLADQALNPRDRRSAILSRIAGIATHWPWLIAGSLLFLGVTLAGLPRLQTALGIFKMFPDDAKVLSDYRWIEENVAPLSPIEVTISVPRTEHGRDSDDPEAWIEELRLVRQVALALQQVERVESVVSPLNFIPAPPLHGSGVSHLLEKNAFGSAMRQSSETLTESGFFRAKSDARHWRVSGRVHASLDPDFAALSRTVESVVAEAFAKENQFSTATYEVSGGAIVFDRMQRRLLYDMGLSFVTAVGLIALVMSVIVRSLRAGLASMLPNMMPPVLLFGTMAWFGVPIEIGSVLTASVAVGIAVDDSVHLIHAFTRSEARSNSEAIADALDHSGPAMIQTTVVCCFGMLVFAFAPFLPIARFAWVIATLLALALVGDLLILPAILASPAGRYVRRRQTRTDESS